MESKTKVLYHANCMDGLAAAWAAHSILGNEYVEYIPVQYGEEPPDVSGCTVYILDFSYRRDTLLKMYEEALHVVVLDHHKSAQEDLKGLDFAYFDMQKSGAMMAWQYFRGSDLLVPNRILLVQYRDLWKFELPDSKAFNAGARALMDEFTIEQFNALDVGEAITAGNVLLKQEAVQLKGHFENRFPVTLCGNLGLACNAPYYHASELGNMLAKDCGTFGLVASYSGKTGLWHYSIRSIGDFDVSEIAKSFGGGGHKNAAGFTSSVLL